MLRGFYQYFALHHCDRKLHWIRYEVQRQWSWEQLGQRPWFELPFAETCIQRYDAAHFVNVIWGAGAGNLHAGFCLGGRVQETMPAR